MGSTEMGSIGEIRMFGGTFAPTGFAICDGSLLAIASYPDLFEEIGTTFGGDGTTTFGLPDLSSSQVPIHRSTDHALGETGTSAIDVVAQPAAITFLIALEAPVEEVYIGEIRTFAFDYVPEGWMSCNGKTLEVPAQNELYDVIGNTYGGEANVTFLLPNLSANLAADGVSGTGSSIGYLVMNYCIAATTGTFPPRG